MLAKEHISAASGTIKPLCTRPSLRLSHQNGLHPSQLKCCFCIRRMIMLSNVGESFGSIHVSLTVLTSCYQVLLILIPKYVPGPPPSLHFGHQWGCSVHCCSPLLSLISSLVLKISILSSCWRNLTTLQIGPWKGYWRMFVAVSHLLNPYVWRVFYSVAPASPEAFSQSPLLLHTGCHVTLASPIRSSDLRFCFGRENAWRNKIGASRGLVCIFWCPV